MATDDDVTLHPKSPDDPPLLPCPFCGEPAAYFVETEDQTLGRSTFNVCCDECEAQSFDCYCLDKASAAKEWNTRA